MSETQLVHKLAECNLLRCHKAKQMGSHSPLPPVAGIWILSVQCIGDCQKRSQEIWCPWSMMQCSLEMFALLGKTQILAWWDNYSSCFMRPNGTYPGINGHWDRCCKSIFGSFHWRLHRKRILISQLTRTFDIICNIEDTSFRKWNEEFSFCTNMLTIRLCTVVVSVGVLSKWNLSLWRGWLFEPTADNSSLAKTNTKAMKLTDKWVGGCETTPLQYCIAIEERLKKEREWAATTTEMFVGCRASNIVPSVRGGSISKLLWSRCETCDPTAMVRIDN